MANLLVMSESRFDPLKVALFGNEVLYHILENLSVNPMMNELYVKFNAIKNLHSPFLVSGKPGGGSFFFIPEQFKSYRASARTFETYIIISILRTLQPCSI
uniref:Uncharacterized protein n=1 Tax=Cacopsylla melanoneura TaxID=428564 RepID=A0A8D8V2M1_9HEMI